MVQFERKRPRYTGRFQAQFYGDLRAARRYGKNAGYGDIGSVCPYLLWQGNAARNAPNSKVAAARGGEVGGAPCT
jgi:hypothetical protein